MAIWQELEAKYYKDVWEPENQRAYTVYPKSPDIKYTIYESVLLRFTDSDYPLVSSNSF
jgi:hypothetical protein